VQDNLGSSAQTHPPLPPHQITPSSILKRHHSLPQQQARSVDNLVAVARSGAPISSRTRRAQAHGVRQYETPDEEDELLDEALTSTQKLTRGMDRNISADCLDRGSDVAPKDNRQPLRQSSSNLGLRNPYPTPSPSANGNTLLFGEDVMSGSSKPLAFHKGDNDAEDHYKWPTPPYEENEWAASAAADIWAASNRI